MATLIRNVRIAAFLRESHKKQFAKAPYYSMLYHKFNSLSSVGITMRCKWVLDFKQWRIQAGVE